MKLHTFILPGHSKVTDKGGGVEYRLDKKDSLGVKGSKPTNGGPAVQEVEVECVVWTDEQVARLVEITAELNRIILRNPLKAVFDFDAPAVRDLGVSKVMVKAISPLLESKDPLGLKRKFLLAHWERPQNAGGTPTGKADKSRPPNLVTDAEDPAVNPEPHEVILQEIPSVEPRPKKERRR